MRPVYDISDGTPHLRVENRVVPSGPTAADICANMAFYLGLVTELAESDNPIWTKMPFAVAEQNFGAAARHGITARQLWPGAGELSVRDLVRDVALPLADDGLRRLGVEPGVAGRLLSIIEGRCAVARNGAAWQIDCVERLQRNEKLDRPDALREMVRRYLRYANTNTPVHEWPLEVLPIRPWCPDNAARRPGAMDGSPVTRPSSPVSAVRRAAGSPTSRSPRASARWWRRCWCTRRWRRGPAPDAARPS